MAFNVKSAIAAAKEQGQLADMSEAEEGGYQLPAEGFVKLRLIGYIELGLREFTFEGRKKNQPAADLIFELSGPNHQPTEGEDGTKYPIRVTCSKVKLSKRDNSNFWKNYWQPMNYKGTASNIAELLGEAFIGEVEHNKVKSADGKERTYVNLKNIRKPFLPNPETGKEYEVNVDAPLSELRLFLWTYPDAAVHREMWDSLFIPGEYEEKKNAKGEVIAPAKSKNVIQNKIREALNWKGNELYDYAEGKVTNADATALEQAVEAGAEEPDDPVDAGAKAADDALAGVA